MFVLCFALIPYETFNRKQWAPSSWGYDLRPDSLTDTLTWFNREIHEKWTALSLLNALWTLEIRSCATRYRANCSRSCTTLGHFSQSPCWAEMYRTAAAGLKMRNRLVYVNSRTCSCIDGEWSTVLIICCQVPTHCNVKKKSLNGNERAFSFFW